MKALGPGVPRTGIEAFRFGGISTQILTDHSCLMLESKYVCIDPKLRDNSAVLAFQDFFL